HLRAGHRACGAGTCQGAAVVRAGDALLEVGERVVDGATLEACIVAHPLPYHDRRLIEQAGIPDGIEPTAPLVVADGVRFDLRAFALDERLAAQMNRLGIAALDDEGIGDILRDAVSVQLEERIDHRVRRREAAASGQSAGPAGGWWPYRGGPAPPSPRRSAASCRVAPAGGAVSAHRGSRRPGAAG